MAAAAEIREDDLLPQENIFVQMYNHAEGILFTFISIFFSTSMMKFHLIVYFLWIMVQLVNDEGKEPPASRLLFALGEGIAIISALMAITTYTALFLIPLMMMAGMECARFVFHSIMVIFYMKGLVQLDRELFFLPDMIENGLELAALCLFGMFFCYFGIIVASALYLFHWCNDVDRQQAEQQEREREQLARLMAARPFILQMPGGPAADIVEENSDSPPNYSLVCGQPPEADSTAKSETSPPRYSRLERGSERVE